MSIATSETPTDALPVSRNCARGNHGRCLGHVAVYPLPKDGPPLTPCGCTAPGCNHGRR